MCSRARGAPFAAIGTRERPIGHCPTCALQYRFIRGLGVAPRARRTSPVSLCTRRRSPGRFSLSLALCLFSLPRAAAACAQPAPPAARLAGARVTRIHCTGGAPRRIPPACAMLRPPKLDTQHATKSRQLPLRQRAQAGAVPGRFGGAAVLATFSENAAKAGLAAGIGRRRAADFGAGLPYQRCS